MFIRTNNTLKGNWILGAAALTAALVVAGVLWLDMPLYRFIHQFDGKIWHVIGDFFGADIWLYLSFPVFLVATCFKRISERIDSVPMIKPKEGFFKRAGHFIKNFKTNLNRFIQWLDFDKKHGGVAGVLSRLSFLVLGAVILESAIVGPLKVVIGRMRPMFLDTLGEYGFVPFTWEWAFNSMPSGHTGASFAGLVTIGMFFPKIKGITWTLAVLVGVSRIAIGVHFPADVLFGAFIGMFAADFVKSYACRVSRS